VNGVLKPDEIVEKLGELHDAKAKLWESKNQLSMDKRLETVTALLEASYHIIKEAESKLNGYLSLRLRENINED
jgi:hypothetical protein|tara:strand:+ start:189 stop:410 length:222 start_codon:yes stop_codon:yes gene_type:complete